MRRHSKCAGDFWRARPSINQQNLDSLAVRIDVDQRTELLAADGETYYVTDHYLNYPVVLVRLSRIHPDSLRDLLGMSWRFVTAKSRPGKSTGEKQKPKRPLSR